MTIIRMCCNCTLIKLVQKHCTYYLFIYCINLQIFYTKTLFLLSPNLLVSASCEANLDFDETYKQTAKRMCAALVAYLQITSDHSNDP
jgi:hypothetical protein